MEKRYGPEFRRCLLECDVDGIMRVFAEAAPHMVQPRTREEALATLHMARTQARSIPDRKRFYSHQYLVERGLPSGLPDELKPSAERMYPVTKSAVGISVGFRADELKPIIPLVRGAMEGAVLEAEADGKLTDSPHVKGRMMEARGKVLRQLLGTTSVSRLKA